MCFHEEQVKTTPWDLNPTIRPWASDSGGWKKGKNPAQGGRPSADWSVHEDRFDPEHRVCWPGVDTNSETAICFWPNNYKV